VYKSIQIFRDNVHENTHLKTLLKGWTATIELHSRDTDEFFHFFYENSSVTPTTQGKATDDTNKIMIAGNKDTLNDIFEGKKKLNRTTNTSELHVTASNLDTIKFDALHQIIWENNADSKSI